MLQAAVKCNTGLHKGMQIPLFSIIISGKYTLIEREFAGEEHDAEPSSSAAVESELAPAVKSLVELICDQKMMEQHLVEIGYKDDGTAFGGDWVYFGYPLGRGFLCSKILFELDLVYSKFL